MISKYLAYLVFIGGTIFTLLAPAVAVDYDAGRVAELRPLLASPETEVRLKALKDLRQVSWPRDDPAYQDVLALLEDPDGRVRSYAAWQAYLKGDAELAKSVLLTVLANTADAAALNSAGVVLQSFGLDDKDFVPPLFALIDHPDQYVRWRSLDCIHRRQGADEQMIPALAQVVKTDEFSTARVAAVRLLGDLAPDCRAANAALIAALDGGDAGVVNEASRLLVKLGPAAAPAVPQLVEYLKNECYDCLYTGVSKVLAELAEIPELRRPITDELLVLLRSDDKYLIHRASKILGEMRTTDPRVRDVALDQLRGTFWESRQLGARLLINVFLDDPGTIAPLIVLLKDQDKYVREYAELALAARQADAAAAIPALIANLDYFYPPVRANAVSALAAIGENGSAVQEALHAALNDADDEVKLQAALALTGLGAVDQEVRNTVDQLCESADDEIAERAELLRQQLAGGS
jgi:HEAT repeat protein